MLSRKKNAKIFSNFFNKLPSLYFEFMHESKIKLGFRQNVLKKEIFYLKFHYIGLIVFEQIVFKIYTL